MIIKKDLKNYLDKAISNYLIIITDGEKITYSNKKIILKNISNELKDKINTIQKDNEVINFFTDTSIEDYNFIMSSNNILYNSIKINNITDKTIQNYSNICKKIINIADVDFDIAKHFKKQNNRGMQCILPIVLDKKHRDSLIIISPETTINQKIKESFFRYSLGVLLTIKNFINNNE